MNDVKMAGEKVIMSNIVPDHFNGLCKNCGTQMDSVDYNGYTDREVIWCNNCGTIALYGGDGTWGSVEWRFPTPAWDYQPTNFSIMFTYNPNNNN